MKREDVIRHAAGGKDRFGDALPDLAAQTIPGAVVYPRSSDEGAGPTNMVIDSLGMLLPAGSIVAPDDQFTVRGKRYEVTGQPFDAGRKGILVSLAGVTQGG